LSCSVHGFFVPVPTPKGERLQLAVLYFIIALALGLWTFNFSSVLAAHGYEHIVRYAWAANGVAAIISPLIVGALADLRYSSERVLRWIGTGAAAFLALLFWAIEKRLHWGWVLALAQLHALWSVPTFGLATSLVMSRLNRARDEFGPVRMWATIGWMVGGVVISVLSIEDATTSGFLAAVLWLVAVSYTYTLKPLPPLVSERKGWKELFGLEAWTLLRHPDHRVVFLGAAIFNIPLSIFYMHTPLHLKDLGVDARSAVMSIGQVLEVVGLFGLAAILNYCRLKTLFMAGMVFGLARYGLFAMNVEWAMVAGIALHGACFISFFMTAQIYLEQRIPGEMRARAQALLSLMTSGIGNLLGYLGCGWWRGVCQSQGVTDWHQYWLGLTLFIAVTLIWFGISYKGRSRMTVEE
jgi:MFS family permease